MGVLMSVPGVGLTPPVWRCQEAHPDGLVASERNAKASIPYREYFMDAPADHAHVNEALAVVAAKVWTTLGSGDVSSADTWDQALAWVVLGQRLTGDDGAELANHLREIVPEWRPLP